LAGFGVVAWAIGHVGATTASADTLPGALIQAYVCNPQLNSQRAVVRATDEVSPRRCPATSRA
jgi:outer membrane protein